MDQFWLPFYKIGMRRDGKFLSKVGRKARPNIFRVLIKIPSLQIDHELYSTLLNEHNGDFRNSDAKSVPPEQGPREPWHDIHSKVEGPIAGDVFKNFYERWQKQVRVFAIIWIQNLNENKENRNNCCSDSFDNIDEHCQSCDQGDPNKSYCQAITSQKIYWWAIGFVNFTASIILFSFLLSLRVSSMAHARRSTDPGSIQMPYRLIPTIQSCGMSSFSGSLMTSWCSIEYAGNTGQ